MFERAKPTKPCAEMPAAVDANPPSSTYWAADATVSRARERWPVTRQPLRRAYAWGISGGGSTAQIRQEGWCRPGSLCRACFPRGPLEPRALPPAVTIHHLQVDGIYC